MKKIDEMRENWNARAKARKDARILETYYKLEAKEAEDKAKRKAACKDLVKQLGVISVTRMGWFAAKALIYQNNSAKLAEIVRDGAVYLAKQKLKVEEPKKPNIFKRLRGKKNNK